ncbi:SDR family oxidoreductase [Paraburkholderia phymatum]|uniref:SDR family oxidoreductase n=1 Tax=Paraburkholderia phymatum TaxID=148447 RepID=UPI003170B830
MDLGIAGKVALVAGGSKGMGRACADMLAAEGCRVVVVAREESAIASAVAAIDAAGGTAIGVSADLTSLDGIRSALAVAKEAFGAPDIVASQTNDFSTGRFMDADPAEYERIFRVFTLATIHLAREAIPSMRQRRWGRFIHIGSGTAKEPEASIPHILHNTVRPSTVAFLKTVADEVAADGVTVNTVAPGWISTEGSRAYLSAEGLDIRAVETSPEVSGGIPAGRVGHPNEIGGIVTFLASQQAAYITGEWIIVDGGKHRSAL